MTGGIRRDRALLLVGFAGALRRSELAAIRVEHLEARGCGLRLTLPQSKGGRAGRAVTVVLPHGATVLWPARALGPLAGGGLHHRKPGVPPVVAATDPGAATSPHPALVLGRTATDAGTVPARGAAGHDRAALGDDSLKRGGAIPAKIKTAPALPGLPPVGGKPMIAPSTVAACRA